MVNDTCSKWRASACALAILGTCGCGPHHHDGGSGGAGAAGIGGAAAGTETSGGGGSAAGSTNTAGTSGDAGGAGPAGTGGVAGTGAAGAGGSTTGDSPGYDSVIGCEGVTWPEAATFRLIGSLTDRFFPSSLSGDGRVIGGQRDGAAVRWTEARGFIPIEGLDSAPVKLSCDGDVAVLWGFAGGVYRESAGGGIEYLFGNASTSSYPLNLSPDGSVIIGNPDDIDGTAGPFPTRWTRDRGRELLEPLRNSLVYHTSSDGNTFLGVDILHIYRWQEGVGKTVLVNNAPLAMDGPPAMPTSTSGNALAFTTRTMRDLMVVVRDGNVDVPYCDVVPCTPSGLSGTGKAVLTWTDSPAGSLIWTREHGFRSLGALIEQFGGSTLGRIVNAQAMSDDGQAFTGTAADPNNPLDYLAFYATLPAAAYE